MSNTSLIVTGAVLLLVGVLLRRWSARHDLKGAAIQSAWAIARAKRTADHPTAIEAKLKEIQGQATLTGKATKTAGTAIAHFAAQGAAVAALVLILAGLALATAGIFWR